MENLQNKWTNDEFIAEINKNYPNSRTTVWGETDAYTFFQTLTGDIKTKIKITILPVEPRHRNSETMGYFIKELEKTHG